MYILGDIGGTKTRLALANNFESFFEPIVFETPKEYGKALELFKEKIDELKGDEILNTAVFGISGILSKERDILERSPHLPNWEKQRLKKELQRICGTDNVLLENDTALVGLGEAVYGAGKKYNLIAYITISTGVGGVRIENKKIDKKIYGFEPGHQILNVDEELLSLEQLVSGPGIKAKTGIDPEHVDESDFWEKVTRNAAIGIHNTILHWSPEAVVLGGGIVLSNKVSVNKVDQYIKELLIVFPETPQIIKAELGDYGGLYGGMAFIKDSLDTKISV